MHAMGISSNPSQTLARNQQITISDPQPRGRRNIFGRLQAAAGTRTAVYFPQVQNRSWQRSTSGSDRDSEAAIVDSRVSILIQHGIGKEEV